MTDKEFKRLNRAQLIDIIYQYQLQVDELTEQNEELKKALEDKRIRIENAGSIALAALEINNCFQNAQNAAEQYLNEIKAIREETEVQRQKILDDAKKEAESIIAGTKKPKDEMDTVIEEILKEYGQDLSDNG